jgi:hypothetical protein
VGGGKIGTAPMSLVAVVALSVSIILFRISELIAVSACTE